MIAMCQVELGFEHRAQHLLHIYDITRMRYFSVAIMVLSFCGAALLLAETSEAEGVYDPLVSVQDGRVEAVDFTLEDSERARQVPIRVYLPHSLTAAPVILFSHGLGGSCQNNPYLGNHWASRGYVVVFMQHLGSDASVWQDVPKAKRLSALKAAATRKNAILRVEDVHFVLDQLEVMNAVESHVLTGRLDLDKVGMSGHSFGAVTTQAVSGQQKLGRSGDTEPRIDAALAMSPSAPKLANHRRAFGDVKIPWLLMTGTKDISVIGNTDLEARLAVYTALPAGDKYELVLDEARHSAFSEHVRPEDASHRNPNHHTAILAISTAFWDAYLKEEAPAKAWLMKEATSVLDEQDSWKWK